MRYLSIFILVLLSLQSCEDVVQIDAPGEEPRLIIDALWRIDTTEGVTNKISVKVSETNSFFGEIPPTGLQQITAVGLDVDNPFLAILNEEEPGSGIYSSFTSAQALIDAGRIILQIDFEEEIYAAFATFVPAPDINTIAQGDGFLNDEDDTEVIVGFTDPADEINHYLFDFDFNNYLVTEDTFYDGQDFSFSYFYDENLEAGDELEISLMGVDEDFFNYMDLLIEQSSEDFGIFETPSVTVRGNFINATEIDNLDFFNNVEMPDNFALGYFAIVEEKKQILTIE